MTAGKHLKLRWQIACVGSSHRFQTLIWSRSVHKCVSFLHLFFAFSDFPRGFAGSTITITPPMTCIMSVQTNNVEIPNPYLGILGYSNIRRISVCYLLECVQSCRHTYFKLYYCVAYTDVIKNNHNYTFFFRRDLSYTQYQFTIF